MKHSCYHFTAAQMMLVGIWGCSNTNLHSMLVWGVLLERDKGSCCETEAIRGIISHKWETNKSPNTVLNVPERKKNTFSSCSCVQNQAFFDSLYVWYLNHVQAMCCSDHLHCCPSNTICDLEHGVCKSGQMHVPLLKKIPAVLNDSKQLLQPFHVDLRCLSCWLY